MQLGHRIRMRRQELLDSNLTYQPLTPDLNPQMKAFFTERKPGQEEITFPLSQQSKEFIFTVQGQLEIQ